LGLAIGEWVAEYAWYNAPLHGGCVALPPPSRSFPDRRGGFGVKRDVKELWGSIAHLNRMAILPHSSG
jgi:hypothetical protein